MSRPIVVTIGPDVEILIGEGTGETRLVLSIDEAKDLFGQMALFAGLRNDWAQETLRAVFKNAVGRIDEVLASLRAQARGSR